ncbi:MAG: ComF family protein [Clostridiales bacterium]|nr:ComF family protein [Clostridiales bacterium]
MKTQASLSTGFLSELREFFWPQRVFCLTCVRPSRGHLLCEQCRSELTSLTRQYDALPRCIHCGDVATGAVCRTCRSLPGVRVSSPWPYQGPAKKLVRALKYDNTGVAADLMASAMVRSLPPLPPDTVITWVPMPASRKRQRGIDHGAMLAEEIGRQLGLPVRALMRRKRHSSAVPQQGLDRTHREQNLQDAFEPIGEAPAHVLLVDDVHTTGATLSACVRALKEGGARHIRAVTATRSVLLGSGDPPDAD